MIPERKERRSLTTTLRACLPACLLAGSAAAMTPPAPRTEAVLRTFADVCAELAEDAVARRAAAAGFAVADAGERARDGASADQRMWVRGAGPEREAVYWQESSRICKVAGSMQGLDRSLVREIFRAWVVGQAPIASFLDAPGFGRRAVLPGPQPGTTHLVTFLMIGRTESDMSMVFWREPGPSSVGGGR